MEQDALLAACDGDLEIECFIRLALDTGARASALCYVEWDTVKFADPVGLCAVQNSTHCRIKTGANRRVGFTAATVSTLRRWRAKRVGAKHLFADPETDRSVRTAYVRIRGKFARVVGESGIPYGTPHDCRRTVATHLQQAGVPLDVAAKLLGHKIPAMTLRYQQPLSDKQITDAVLAVERYRAEQKRIFCAHIARAL